MSVPLTIRGGKQTREAPKQKARYSCFLVTINTNQRYKADDKYKQSDTDFFENVIRADILEKLPNYIKVIEDGHSWSNNHIHDVTVDYVMEFGGKTNSLHAHILIKIKHNSKVQLNYQLMKEKVKESLGLKNIYFNNRLVRPTSDDWLMDYIDKMK